MSHPLCGSVVCNDPKYPTFPDIGWEGWSGKAIYIRVTIDDSVTHLVACGKAIQNWNSIVGPRFFLAEDIDRRLNVGGEITYFEKREDEWPFNSHRDSRGSAYAGLAFNYDKDDKMLGLSPGRVARCDIYVNKSMRNLRERDWINLFAHETGHAFMLADHQNDDINSVLSYKVSGRLLVGPSWEDADGIAHQYGLKDLVVRPADLDGIENVAVMWHYDRYGKRHRSSQSFRSWAFWISTLQSIRVGERDDVIESLEPYEVYWVKPKREGLLGFGRFELALIPGETHRWFYM